MCTEYTQMCTAMKNKGVKNQNYNETLKTNSKKYALNKLIKSD